MELFVLIMLAALIGGWTTWAITALLKARQTDRAQAKQRHPAGTARLALSRTEAFDIGYDSGIINERNRVRHLITGSPELELLEAAWEADQ